MTSRIARHALVALSSLVLLGALACDSTKSSSGDGNNTVNNNTSENNNTSNNNTVNNNTSNNNNTNNNTANNNTTNNNTANNNTANNNTVNNNTPDPIAACMEACTSLGTTCRNEFLAECPAQVVDGLIPACQQGCNDDNARAQITAVAALPCATVVPLAIDGFGLAELCAPAPDLCDEVVCEAESACDPADGMCKPIDLDLCADVLCDEGSTCDPTDGVCKPDAVDLCADVLCDSGTTCNPETGACDPIVCDADELEADPGNNTQETATVVPAAGASWTGLSICAEDQDWFRLDIPADTTMLIRALFTHADGDLDLVIFDEAGDYVTDATSSDDNEFLAYDGSVETSTYWLLVEGFEGAVNTYDLSIAFNPEGTLCVDSFDCEVGVCDLGLCGPCTTDSSCDGGFCDVGTGTCVECNADADCNSGESCVENTCTFICMDDSDEPNDTSAAPTTLASSELNRELSICGDDQDWYGITVPANMSALARIRFNTSIGDLDMDLYQADSLEEPFNNSNSTSDDEFLVIGANEIETSWLLNIFGYEGEENTYRLELRYGADGDFCRANLDCDAGFCNQGECEACTTDSQCGFGQVCDVETGACVTPPCQDDLDCDFFMVCETGQGLCVECITDSDCIEGTCSQDNTCSF